ncbi:MAG: hypothetical protein AABX05_02645, partial [Nanoarchaeota archaeon]
GCLDQENMLTLMKPGAYLMKKLDIITTLGFSEKSFDKGVAYIENNLPKSATADMYVFIPSQYGFRATTTITALDVHLNGGCEFGSSNNNNNNNNNSNNNGDCAGFLFCDHFAGNSLNTENWHVVNDYGISVSDGWLTLPDASIITSAKGYLTACQDSLTEFKADVSAGSLYSGNGISVYGIGSETILQCDEKQMSFPFALDGSRRMGLRKKNDTLYLLKEGTIIGSMPCYASPTEVQLVAGIGDIVKMDYVTAKCE